MALSSTIQCQVILSSTEQHQIILSYTVQYYYSTLIYYLVLSSNIQYSLVLSSTFTDTIRFYCIPLESNIQYYLVVYSDIKIIRQNYITLYSTISTYNYPYLVSFCSFDCNLIFLQYLNSHMAVAGSSYSFALLWHKGYSHCRPFSRSLSYWVFISNPHNFSGMPG